MSLLTDTSIINNWNNCGQGVINALSVVQRYSLKDAKTVLQSALNVLERRSDNIHKMISTIHAMKDGMIEGGKPPQFDWEWLRQILPTAAASFPFPFGSKPEEWYFVNVMGNLFAYYVDRKIHPDGWEYNVNSNTWCLD